MNSEFSKLENSTRDSDYTSFKLDIGPLKDITLNLNEENYPHDFSFEK
jgi:hypothetical protein